VSHKPDKRHPTKSCLSVVFEIKLVTQLLPSGSGPSSSHPAIQPSSHPAIQPSSLSVRQSIGHRSSVGQAGPNGVSCVNRAKQADRKPFSCSFPRCHSHRNQFLANRNPKSCPELDCLHVIRLNAFCGNYCNFLVLSSSRTHIAPYIGVLTVGLLSLLPHLLNKLWGPAEVCSQGKHSSKD